jgi:hypothetical protein
MRKFLSLLIFASAAFLGVCLQNETSAPCVNKLRRWHPAEEEKYFGPIRSIQVDEQIYEFESHFIYVHDKPLPTRYMEFDEKGRLIKEHDYRIDGVPSPLTLYEYDDNGFLVKENNLSAVTQQPYLETKYVYNADGTNKEIIQTGLDNGTVYSRWVISGDSNGNYADISETESKTGWEFHVGIRRDSKCRVSEIYAYPPFVSVPIVKGSFLYDEKDNPVSVMQYTAIGTTLGQRKLEYEFDDNGNWVKRSDYAWKEEKDRSDWKLMNVLYRNITYFDTK